MDLYKLYVNILFSDRMLTVALAIATLNYFKKNLVDFTLSIFVTTNTPHNITYVCQNDATKAQVSTTAKGAEASKHRRLVMGCGLNKTPKNLLQFFNQPPSSNENKLTIPLCLTKKVDVALTNKRTIKQK